jgi:AGCS family alanine or glycine:cation symporter
MKWFAVIFAVVAVFSCGLLMPGIQSNSIANACAKGFNMSTLTSGILVTALMALVIFGGAKRIGRVAELVVPFMALAYIIMSIIIIIVDIRRVPEVLRLIFASAFGADGLFGGIVGSAIAWGVKRGIYSNEAGQGTGPQAAAAAEVAHPAQQGLVQAFSVYVDTLGVCSATGLMLLLTDKYNVTGGSGALLKNNLPGVEHGPQYTQAAVDTIFPGFGSGFVAIALFFFAFTTIMAYAYYAESNMAYLVRGRASKMFINVIRLGLLVMVFYGAIREADLMWAMGDIGVGLMAWLNLIAILALSGVGFKVLKDYERQIKNGGSLSFEPEKLGVRNTESWGKD